MRQRETLPPSRPVDPRLFIDSDGLTSFVLARNRHRLGLVSLLNPFTSLSAAFDAEAAADRPIGVATLQQIAAKVGATSPCREMAGGLSFYVPRV